MVTDKHGFDGFVHVHTGPNWGYTGLTDVLPGVHQSCAPLVNAVIVGEVEMGYMVLVKRGEPFGFGTENELLEVGLNGLCGRAL